MEEPTQPAKKRKVEPAERKHSIDYTLEETQTLIRARGVHSKVLDGAGATNAQRRAVWQAITDAVNAVSPIGGREPTSVQQRYKNIFKEYKRYKSELRHPPTGDGPLSVKKPYFDTFEEVCPGDSRIEGVGGVDLGTQSPAEMAEAVKSIATQQSQPVFPELESQQLSEKSAWDISGVYDDDADTVSTAGTVHGSSSTVFRTPTVIKPRRKSSAVVDSNVLAKDSMKLEVVEMQRKLLMQQQSNAMFERQALEQWSEGIGEWRENLRKYSALLDVQLHRARRNQTPDTEDLAALNLLSAELPPSSIRVDDDDSVLADHNRRSSPF